MVKKLTKWLSLIIFTLFLGSCGLFKTDSPEENETNDPTEDVVDQDQNEDSNEDEEPEDVQDSDEVNQDLSAWIPRLDNVVYRYEGTGIEYTTFTSTPQFNQENYYQVVKDNGGTILAEVFEYTGNEIVRVFSRPETYFIDNFSSIGIPENDRLEEIVLMQPIAVGTSWTAGEAEYEITSVNAKVEVPAGNYDTIEVTATFEDSVVKRYYAEDVGLVSEVTDTNDETVESNLEAIQTETAETLPITVYVPDDQAMGIDTVDAELSLYTNEAARIAISDLLRGDNADYPDIFILPEGAELNYLFLNDSNIVEADITSEYISNMNVGSSGESLFLHSLANTLLDYYGAEELLLTVDGEPYSGGHILLREGETISFNNDILN